ncbi:hypothetical protein GEMRC1_001960 [Eukaryota sp. GEM-RC1]
MVTIRLAPPSTSQLNTSRCDLPTSTMKSLNIRPGDPVLINVPTSSTKILCSAWPSVNKTASYCPADHSVYTCNSLTASPKCHNCEASLEKVCFTPLQELILRIPSLPSPLLAADLSVLKKCLLGRYFFPNVLVSTPFGTATVSQMSPSSQGVGKVVLTTHLTVHNGGNLFCDAQEVVKGKKGFETGRSSLKFLLDSKFRQVWLSPMLAASQKSNQIDNHCLLIESTRTDNDVVEELRLYAAELNIKFLLFRAPNFQTSFLTNFRSSSHMIVIQDVDLLARDVIDDVIKIIKSIDRSPVVLVLTSPRADF